MSDLDLDAIHAWQQELLAGKPWAWGPTNICTRVSALIAEVDRLRPLADIGQVVVDEALPAEEFVARARLFCDCLAERDRLRAIVSVPCQCGRLPGPA